MTEGKPMDAVVTIRDESAAAVFHEAFLAEGPHG